MGTAILLVPTQDWKEIRWFHHKFTPFRAVENGFSVVKAAGDGISATFDQYGRPIDEQDWYEDKSRHRILYSNVPSSPVSTLFPKASVGFPVLCLLILIASFVVSRKQRS